MSEVLKRIKRCIVQGNVRFTFKAELEMLADGLSRTDVLESILTAQAIAKIIRSPAIPGKRPAERLYVIQGFTFDNLLVYTKGKLHRESREDTYYILLSSKRAAEG